MNFNYRKTKAKNTNGANAWNGNGNMPKNPPQPAVVALLSMKWTLRWPKSWDSRVSALPKNNPSLPLNQLTN